jgi:hypothetical protein
MIETAGVHTGAFLFLLQFEVLIVLLVAVLSFCLYRALMLSKTIRDHTLACSQVCLLVM